MKQVLLGGWNGVSAWALLLSLSCALLATPAYAQVEGPSYGQGPGAVGVAPRSAPQSGAAGVAPGSAPQSGVAVEARALPRTGSGPAEDWQLLGGVTLLVVVAIGLAGAMGLRGLARFGRVSTNDPKTRVRALAALVGAAGLLAVSSGTPSLATAQAQPSRCHVSGSAQQFAPTIAEFGTAGSAYQSRHDNGSYWSGRGYVFGFHRAEWEAMMNNPGGAYLIGGVVVAPDDRTAATDLRDAVSGWTQDWGPVKTLTLPAPVGDEVIAVHRLTPWEIDQDQPMEEVFLAFRHCNATVHFLLATMPEFDPAAQALRYARLIDGRM
jgi:hypothetical protein